MPPRKFAILILLAIITVCWWFLAGHREPAEGEGRLNPGASDATPLASSTSDPFLPPVADIAPSVRTRALPNPDGTDPIIPSIPLETGELAWEKTLEEIAKANTPDAEKGRRMLETLPTMPVEARETAAERAVALIPSTDYRSAQAALSNPAMFGSAMGILFGDLMNRPDEIRLPTLLMIARNPEHPYAPNARDNLNLILGKNLGTDWTGWDAAIRQHLAAKR